MTPQLSTARITSSTSHDNEGSAYTTRASKRSRNGGPSVITSRSAEPSSSRIKRHVGSKDEHKQIRPKPPLSCGECRRLKLKCDRVFPCQSCVKRGCGGICPEGSLTSGRGSRYILANTEQLHEKILQMADRIRDLEDALQSLHYEHFQCQHSPSATAPPHALLRGKLLLVKSQLELYGIDPLRLAAQSARPHIESSSEELTDIDVSDDGASSKMRSSLNAKSAQSALGHAAFDTDRQSCLEIDASIQGVWSSLNSIRLEQEPRDGLCTDNDLGAQRVELSLGADTTHTASTPRYCHILSGEIIPDDLPEELKNLSASFPLAWTINNATSNVQIEHTAANIVKRIRAFLPPRDEAIHLCRIVRENLLWQLNCVISDQASMSLISEVYDISPANLNPHKLSLLLMLFVVGKGVETTWWSRSEGNRASRSLNHQSPADGIERRRRAGLTMKAYHQLARASLCAIPITSQPDLFTVQTLLLMTWYLLVISEDKQAGFAAWGVMGITAKLAQALGLHREASQCVGSAESQQERRLLFWEILHLDARLSLAIGRPPSFSSTYMDCKRPICSGPNGIFPNRLEACYYEFKFAFYEDCLVKVTEYSLCTLRPDYAALLEHDCKVRDYKIPPGLTYEAGPEMEDLNNTNLPVYMLKLQQYHAKQWKDSAILQLHRTFYSQTLCESKARGSPSPVPVDSSTTETDAYMHWPSLLCEPYAPSVLATFVSACNIISDLEKLYQSVSDICPHYAVFWFNAFCAGVALCLLVSRVPSFPLTPIALRELARVTEVFNSASTKSPKVARSSKVLHSLVSKARSAYRHWEASTNQVASSRQSTDAAHKEQLRVLFDHLLLFTQDGSRCTTSAYASEARSADPPINTNIWRKVHPELIQLLAKLLSMEDDQGRSLPIGGSRDNAATDGHRLYLPAEPTGEATSRWDMMEEGGVFDATYNDQGPSATIPRSDNRDVSHVPIDLPAQAFSTCSYPIQPDPTDQVMANASSSGLWYAHNFGMNEPHSHGYEMSNDASNILAYNYALTNYLSNHSTQLVVPVEETLPMSQLHAAPGAYNGADSVSSSTNFQSMDLGLGVFTNSAPSSEQYHHSTTSPNDWGH